MESLNMGWWFLFLIGGITGFVFFGNAMLSLIKWGWILMVRISIGALFLFFFNLIGQLFQFHLSLNLVTSFLVGVLGIPGLSALVIIKLLILPFLS